MGKSALSDKKNILFVTQLLDAIDGAFFIINENGQVLLANQSAASLCGVSIDDFPGRSIDDIFIFPGEVGDTFRSQLDLQELVHSSNKYVVNTKNGESCSFNVRAIAQDEAQQTLYILLISKFVADKVDQIDLINQTLVKIDELLINGSDISGKYLELAELLIPDFADWCCIHLINPDTSVNRVALAPESITENQAVYEWLENDLLNDESDGLPEVLRKGKKIFIPEVNPIRRAADAGIKSYIVVPLIVNHQTYGTITFISAESGRHFDPVNTTIAENIALHLSVYLEKSQLHLESEERNEEFVSKVDESTNELREAMSHLKQSEELIQTLFRISNKLNATLDVDLILDTLAQEAIQMVNGESGFAGLKTEQGMAVKKYFSQGVETPFEHTWALGEGIPGWVLKFKVPYGTSDAASDPLIDRNLAINANVRSIICTPILDTVGEVIAYFDIRNKLDSEGFSINDQEMLLTLAPVASIAIQNALTYQQHLARVSELKDSARQYQELAASLETTREEERVHIARELHDQLGQALTAIKFDLVWLTEQLNQKDETLSQKTKDITSQVNATINTVRQIATGLRPGMLEDLGLPASIEWQAHDFAKRSGIECKVHMTDEDFGLTPDQSLAIYRIFQEALTNVIRYAGAKKVDVTILKSIDFFTLEMHDDGKGINLDDISDNLSIGIAGMRERAKQFDGIFEIHGAPEQGTTLMVTIPIRKTG